MRRPKPPTPGSVSATLRTAGFRAIGDGDEGYDVAWVDEENRTGGIHVAFFDYTGDGSAAAHERQARAEADARSKMAATLRHKGWRVDELPGHLIVRGQLEVARA